MSCFLITLQDGKKMGRPVASLTEYEALRDSAAQRANLQQARQGDEHAKRRLVQFNYSCLMNPDGTLRGTAQVSRSVGMDIDHVEQLEPLIQTILEKQETLGLLLLERSARGQGLHVVFSRHPELTNEQNLRWASDLLGVEYDKGAKDLTRVFFATSNSPEDLLYISSKLFDNTAPEVVPSASGCAPQTLGSTPQASGCAPQATGSVPQVSGKAPASVPAQALSGDQNFTLAASEPVTPQVPAASPVSQASSASEVSPTSAPAIASGTSQLSPFKGDQGGLGLLSYQGIPYAQIIRKYWEMNNGGQEPVTSNRNTLTFELATNLRHICGFDRNLMDQVIPCYDGFSPEEKMRCIDSALNEKLTQMPRRLREVLAALRKDYLVQTSEASSALSGTIDEMLSDDDLYYAKHLPKMPQGIKDSIDAVGPRLAMPVLVGICPVIGMLASGVQLDVHGRMCNLNLISYIVGDSASGKGDLDQLVKAWTSEIKAQDKLYEAQMKEWRQKMRASKNKKELPVEPELPIRILTLNNTVPNLAVQLANIDGMHGFSFTPEADIVSLKWKSDVNDFSVMIRQSYDGSSYDRQARSVDAVNVHIEKLLWNVTMCGTPDALYRVVNNYTDGFQSRIALASTPDNTFQQLDAKPYRLTPYLQERIGQVAHLLPLMKGSIELYQLEKRGREWLEAIRQETIKNDDKVKARQRFRICVTAQRMTCCVMLCKICEQLIQKYGLHGAEMQLRDHPDLWKDLLIKAQSPVMLDILSLLADFLMDNALFYFRSRIEAAYQGRNYVGHTEVRTRRGRNDSIFARLGEQFTVEQAYQHSQAVKGFGVSSNSVRQMLKNWRQQGLVLKNADGTFSKLRS